MIPEEIHAYCKSLPAPEPEMLQHLTRGITECNDYVQQDSSIENMLLPFRGGIMMIRKI